MSSFGTARFFPVSTSLPRALKRTQSVRHNQPQWQSAPAAHARFPPILERLLKNSNSSTSAVPCFAATIYGTAGDASRDHVATPVASPGRMVYGVPALVPFPIRKMGYTFLKTGRHRYTNPECTCEPGLHGMKVKSVSLPRLPLFLLAPLWIPDDVEGTDRQTEHTQEGKIRRKPVSSLLLLLLLLLERMKLAIICRQDRALVYIVPCSPRFLQKSICFPTFRLFCI